MEMLVERLIQIAYFAGQSLIVVVALLVLISFIFSLAQKSQDKGEIEVEDLSKKFKRYSNALKMSSMNKKQLKAEKKAEKQKEKSEKKKKNEDELPTAFVLDFEGDVKASAVDKLRTEISTVLSTASDKDEVIIRLESPGGVVHGYGLAASQLQRIKDKNIRLTVCVDKVAASGGYMMACIADEIIAAPFAILGSIGVLAQVPNFSKILKKNDVDYREVTAGDYKRTISIFGEITEAGEEKFREQIVDTHQLFKDHVKKNRPQLDMDKVGTGEYWFGHRAYDLKLADRLATSDSVLMEKFNTHTVKSIKFEEKKKLAEKLGFAASKVLGQAFLKVWTKIEAQRYL